MQCITQLATVPLFLPLKDAQAFLDHHQVVEQIMKEQEHLHMKSATKFLCDYVNASIIRDNHVERISMLKEKYFQYMYENHPQHYNSDYKMDKLKNKLIRHFGTAISFWRPNHRAELVYASNVHSGNLYRNIL